MRFDIEIERQHISELNRLLEIRREFIKRYERHPWLNRQYLRRVEEMRRDWLQLYAEYYPEG